RPAPPPAPRPVAASPHTRAPGARAARARGAGILGTLLGIGAGVLIGRIAGWRSLIPRRSPLPLSFSGVVGLGFGVYRARRAARFDPHGRPASRVSGGRAWNRIPCNGERRPCR